MNFAKIYEAEEGGAYSASSSSALENQTAKLVSSDISSETNSTFRPTEVTNRLR